MSTVNSENGITQGELRTLKSALIDSQPLPLPPHSSDAAVAELHEMMMELRNFAANMLNGNPSPPFSHKGFMTGVMKSLQAQFQSLSLQARAVSPNEPVSSLHGITQQLIDAKKRLEEADQTLKLHMEKDALTGLYNFSYLMKTLENEIERSRRYNESLSIVLLDLDNFMKINDSHGYRVGDAVLEEIAALLREILRPSDTAGRYSGGEFLLILPNTDRDGACVLADRIRTLIATTPCTDSNISVSISAGIAKWDNHSMVDLIHEANGNLHAVKHKRKNKS